MRFYFPSVPFLNQREIEEEDFSPPSLGDDKRFYFSPLRRKSELILS